MNMRDLLTIERVIPGLRARDKRDVLRRLATHAVGDTDVPSTAIVRSVLECAELPAFGPAVGVSLPHAFVPGLRNPIATFARLALAIDFGAPDGSKADLVTLLLSPTDNAGGHLRALACIARTLRDRNVRNLLRAAESRDSLYVILCGSEDPLSSREPASPESVPQPQQKQR